MVPPWVPLIVVIAQAEAHDSPIGEVTVKVERPKRQVCKTGQYYSFFVRRNEIGLITKAFWRCC